MNEPNPFRELSGAARQEYFQVQNFEAVYAHVEQTWQDPERAADYHRLAGRVMHPDTIFGPGVEDRIGQALKNGARLAIAFTHGKFVDPGEIAAMAEQNDVFEPMKGITMIGAKIPIFMYPLLGKRVADLGAYPIWRDKDVIDRKKQSPEEQAFFKEWQKKAGRASIDLEITGINEHGLHVVKHVEGTRKAKPPEQKGHPLKIKTVRDGFGETVAGVDPNIELLMVTAAFYYGRVRNFNRTLLSPTIYLDIPENQRHDDPDEVTRTIRPSLQETMYWAAALHRR
jgi:hypothetical protein